MSHDEWKDIKVATLILKQICRNCFCIRRDILIARDDDRFNAPTAHATAVFPAAPQPRTQPVAALPAVERLRHCGFSVQSFLFKFVSDSQL